MARAVALGLLLAWPCADYARSSSAEGGPPWREYVTVHFVIRTPLAPEDARRVAARLEQLYAAVSRGISSRGVAASGRIEAIALDERDMEEFGGDGAVRVTGWFEADAFGPRLVVGSERADAPVLAHELSHYLLAHVFPRLPLWLNEGLAGFYETIELEPKEGGRVRAVIGRPPNTLRIVPRRKLLDARREEVRALVRSPRLFTWESSPPEDGRELLDLYATSWATVHYFANREPARLSQFLSRLTRAEEPVLAFRSAFPELDPSRPDGARALDDALESYVDGATYRFLAVELAVDDGISSEQPLSDAALRAIRAGLFARSPAPIAGREEKVAAEIAASLRALPDNPAALWYSPDGKSRARAAIAAAPGDWRGWILLARSLPEDDSAWAERSAALRKAAALAPEIAAVQNELAWALLGHGDSGEALPIARRAVQLAPWSAPIVDTLASVREDLGSCPEALALERRALELLREGRQEDLAKELRKKVSALQARCGAR